MKTSHQSESKTILKFFLRYYLVGIYTYDLSNQYMATWKTVMRTKIWCHKKAYVRVIVCIVFYLYPWYWKIHPNTGRAPGTGAKGKKKNMAESVRGTFTVGTFEDFILVNKDPIV